ncbi:hypothetical protein QLX08_011217 [Tetragonisca angustula]|uniref:Uncharacterized protein n=1 Tax=Tetragonisca angustula TaxID=166442 RepID=A0AAW0Z909_9HYME
MMSNGIWVSTEEVGGKPMSNNKNYLPVTSSTLNSPLMKLSSYFLAVRPWSLSASLMPTLLGSALAYRLTSTASFSWISLILTVYTVFCVHGAGNVVNTYFDYIKGVDSRKSDDRILVDQLLSKDELVSLGGIGFKYIALGDVLILVIFGPISVLFAFMAQTGYIELGTIYYAIPLALNTEAILHSNNTRDLESDKKAVTTLPTAFKIEKQFRSPHMIQSVPKQTAKLNMFLGILYVIACLLVDPLPYL